MGNRAESQELVRLGSRIRELRLSAGMSQEMLAEKAGISPNTVSRIEGGLTEMYVETFRKLAQTACCGKCAVIFYAGTIWEWPETGMALSPARTGKSCGLWKRKACGIKNKRDEPCVHNKAFLLRR